MRSLLISILLLAMAQVHAAGFAVSDLSSIAADVNAALGTGFSHKAESKRILLMCTDCKGEHIIDIQIGRQDDGTEQRVRSGQTPISTLEKLCQGKNPSCELSKLNVAPAVGWISSWKMDPKQVSTVIIILDGDLLTIRSIASDNTAQSYAEKTLAAVSHRLFGK